MPAITTKEGTQIYYKDWGSGQPVIVKGSTLKVYPGLPHRMCSTHKDLINADLLAFPEA